MNAAEYINFMSELYRNSSIPVLIFSGSMKVIWNNKIFNQYFPAENIKNKTVSALFKAPVRESLLKSPGFSVKFEIKVKYENKLTSEVNLLVFPAEVRSNTPKLFIGYIDDITDERRMTLRKTYLGLLEASKLKDDDTGNHIKRVGAYAKRLSEELYKLKKYDIINLDFIENIHFLAPMHDVGKIGTPDEILNKKGPLDESEWRIMKEHTINGALILANYPESMAMEIARAHHERWDGSGYPYQIESNDIPLAARITAIADVYDALRMKRSYKEAFPHDKSVEIIRKDSGTHFDPSLIEVFISISESFNAIYNALADGEGAVTSAPIEELPVFKMDPEDIEYSEAIETLEELEELEEL
ncbi:MAG: HD domain-containing protein [Spirochaetales bacterium]|nr:HD domain-containing protein [Spirochaetales bacterium]